MEKKIFRSIFIVAFGVLIVNTYAIIRILYTYAHNNNIIKELGFTPFSFIMSILQPLLIITTVLLVVATVVASNVARMIVGPINNIDLENPTDSEVYGEIKPLINKISKQSRQLRRQIKEAQHRQAEFATIAKNMNEGILIIDTKYEVLSYNNAMLNLFTDGKAPSSKSVFAFNRSKEFRKIIKKALSGKQKEKIIEIKNNSYMIIANPVYENKLIIGAVILVMDVTETVERENYRREFTANVSHELKTPLTSISGFAELIKSGLASPEDMPDMAGRIYDESQRLIVLVNDIIKLSALDDESISYEDEEIYLYDLVDELRERLDNVLSEKEIKFDIENEDDIVIKAPRNIVSELLYNLCDNAIKYNKEGGSVTVEIKREKKKAIIKVTDTGIGIDREHQDRIFERFYRVDKSHSKEVGGTGLGLSIVKHDVAYLGGDISVESKLGEGTCMTVKIPM